MENSKLSSQTNLPTEKKTWNTPTLEIISVNSGTNPSYAETTPTTFGHVS